MDDVEQHSGLVLFMDEAVGYVRAMSSIAAEDGEFLEDGASARTPDGDNLLLDHARAEAAAYGSLVRAAGGRLLDDDEGGLHLRDLGSASPFGNVALVTRPVLSTQVVLDRLRGFYEGERGGPYLVISPWPTANWGPEGYTRVGHPPLMVRLPGDAVEPVAGLHIAEASDLETIHDFERTLIEAYPMPEMQPWTPETFVGLSILDTEWRLFVGYEDGVPVATAGAFVTPSIVLVELVSVRSQCRGRGYGRALTAAASCCRPDRPAMLISSDDGRGVYESLGYVSLLRYTLWLGRR